MEENKLIKIVTTKYEDRKNAPHEELTTEVTVTKAKIQKDKRECDPLS